MAEMKEKIVVGKIEIVEDQTGRETQGTKNGENMRLVTVKVELTSDVKKAVVAAGVTVNEIEEGTKFIIIIIFSCNLSICSFKLVCFSHENTFRIF